MVTLPPTERKTKDTQVYDLLKRRILDNELRPGSRLIEEDICRELSVTRTPVRHALRRLEHEGLIVGEAYRGCHVREIGIDEVGPLFDVREVLEGLAARNMAAAENAADIARLRALSEQVDAAAQNGDWTTYFRVDQQFHRTLIECSGNPKLIEIMEISSFHLRTFAAYDPFLDSIIADIQRNIKRFVYRHTGLVEAIGSGDPELAEAAVRSHIRDAKKTMLAVLAERAKV